VKIYAIDPGPHTGIFWLDGLLNPCRITLDYTTGPVKETALKHLYFWLMGTVVPTKDKIVVESFEFRKEDAQNREYIDYSTGEFVGVVKLFCQLTGTPCYVQSASVGKGFWDDSKLKRVGMWVPGTANRHIRDATRHWLHHVTFTVGDEFWLRRLK